MYGCAGNAPSLPPQYPPPRAMPATRYSPRDGAGPRLREPAPQAILTDSEAPWNACPGILDSVGSAGATRRGDEPRMMPSTHKTVSLPLLTSVAALGLMAAVALLPTSAAGQGNAPADSSGSTATSSSADTNQVAVPVPTPGGKKLVLKNGTYQIVREYHREGDRVRYYSAERLQWEEIPAALVDWKATEQAAAEQTAEQKALLAKIKASEEAERRASLDVDTSLEVRPGVFLPDGPGLYVLSGKQVFSMRQDLAESHTDKVRAFEKIVTGLPVISSKQHVDLPGKHAKVRLDTRDPEFYFRGEHGRQPRFRLLRAKIKGNQRELMTINTNLAGENTYNNHAMDLQTWNAARGVYRYTLGQTLQPGEYALVEMTLNGPALYVWDFGVDAGKKARKKRGRPGQGGAIAAPGLGWFPQTPPPRPR